MLIPRFTIRWLLLLTTLSGVFFLTVSLAVQGKTWAIALSLAVGSVVVAFLLYAAFFGFAFILASMLGGFRQVPGTGSPFATGAPPPQIVPPSEPDTF